MVCRCAGDSDVSVFQVDWGVRGPHPVLLTWDVVASLGILSFSGQRGVQRDERPRFLISQSGDRGKAFRKVLPACYLVRHRRSSGSDE